MKNNIYKFGMTAAVCAFLASCASEHINEPTMAGLPQASDYKIGISVDELNNVELNILDKNGNRAVGVYPVWYVNNSTRPSTSLTYKNLFTVAGDYPVEMKIGNANGVSEGSVTDSFHIDKTIFDFAPYMRALTEDGAKEWSVDSEKQGHMGCGGSTENPTEWWSAGVGDKAAEGVYDNILVFGSTGEASSGSYIYDPGASGTFYVNQGVQSLPGYTVNNPGTGDDFRVNAKVVESSFTLVAEGAYLYLTLPSETPFPYIPSEAAFMAPKYRVASCTKNEVTLVQDLEGISWQYILAPKAEGIGDVTTTGFDYNGEHNLWKDAEVTLASTWFATSGWAELPDQPTVTITEKKGISLHVPAETGDDQWQGQVHIQTNIPVSASNTYDFSCKVNVPKAGMVTVKVQKDGDDDTFLTADRVAVEPDGDIVWGAEMDGFDGTLKIAFDFGGYADCDVEISDIVFKESQYDDGTILPVPEISDADNMFADFKVVKYSTWFADGGWGELASQPEILFFDDGYSFVSPEGMGGDQWQGQVHVWTDVATSADHKYSFMLTIESDKDINGVTIKIQKGDSLGDDPDTDDNTFINISRVNVEAGIPYTYFFYKKKGIDASNIQICMDYAGAPDGTNITVSDIRMKQE